MEVLLNWLSRSLEKMRGSQPEVEHPSTITLSLRELQLSINPLMLAELDSQTRLIVFFLNSYIDSVFMDLLGDIPDDADGVLAGIREKFFHDIIEGFDDLLNKLRNCETPLPAMEGLVDSYITAIKELNYKDIQLGGVR